MKYDEILKALDASSGIGGGDTLLEFYGDDIKRAVEAWKAVEEGHLTVGWYAWAKVDGWRVHSPKTGIGEFNPHIRDPISAVLAAAKEQA